MGYVYTWLRTEKVLVWRAVLLGRMNSDDREGWHLPEFGFLVFCKNRRNKLDFLSIFETKLLAGGSFWLDGFQRQKGRMCLSGCQSIGMSVRNACFFRWNPTTEYRIARQIFGKKVFFARFSSCLTKCVNSRFSGELPLVGYSCATFQ